MATGRIELAVEDRKLLEGWSRAQRVEHRLKIRSQIILKAAEGCSGREIGKSLSIPEVTVSKWRRRFLRHGIAGLEDAPRSGKPAKYDEVTVQRVLELLDRTHRRAMALEWAADCPAVDRCFPRSSLAHFAPTRHRIGTAPQLVHFD